MKVYKDEVAAGAAVAAFVTAIQSGSDLQIQNASRLAIGVISLSAAFLQLRADKPMNKIFYDTCKLYFKKGQTDPYSTLVAETLLLCAKFGASASIFTLWAVVNKYPVTTAQVACFSGAIVLASTVGSSLV